MCVPLTLFVIVIQEHLCACAAPEGRPHPSVPAQPSCFCWEPAHGRPRQRRPGCRWSCGVAACRPGGSPWQPTQRQRRSLALAQGQASSREGWLDGRGGVGQLPAQAQSSAASELPAAAEPCSVPAVAGTALERRETQSGPLQQSHWLWGLDVAPAHWLWAPAVGGPGGAAAALQQKPLQEPAGLQQCQDGCCVAAAPLPQTQWLLAPSAGVAQRLASVPTRLHHANELSRMPLRRPEWFQSARLVLLLHDGCIHCYSNNRVDWNTPDCWQLAEQLLRATAGPFLHAGLGCVHFSLQKSCAAPQRSFPHWAPQLKTQQVNTHLLLEPCYCLRAPQNQSRGSA